MGLNPLSVPMNVLSQCLKCLDAARISAPSLRPITCIVTGLINLLVTSSAWGLYTPPSNPFIAPGETPVILDITSGTIAQVQQQIDDARMANPSDYIIINLSGTYTVSTTPLVLSSKQILYLDGMIKASSPTATATSLISVGSGESFVAIMGFGPGSILDGQTADMHGVEVIASSRVVIDNLTVQDTGRDGLSVQGLGNTVWDAQISISRCNVSGSGDSGIRLYDANQCAVIDNICQSNTTAGIELSADTTALGNNTCNSNATGISVSGANNSLYSNTCDGNAVGVNLTATSDTTSLTANTVSTNSTTGIVVDGSNNTIFDNTYSGNTLNLDSQGSSNHIVASLVALDGVGNDYFYPPTARNPHSSTEIANGKGRHNLTITSTTIDSVQTQYDAAVTANPNDVIVLTLDGTFTLGANPLDLSSYTCVLLEATTTIDSDASTTATYAIEATGESFISISGGTLDGNLELVGGVEFTNCSMILIDGVTMLNSGDKAVRGTSDMIHLVGGSAPKIVRGCTIDTCDARGIWSQGSACLITDNTITNCNMDGIDIDSFSSKCLVANNTCTDHLRDGIFVEEGANRNIVIDNDLRRTQIGVNVFSFNNGPTQYNSVLCNYIDSNERALRDGCNTGQETKHNYFYNNVGTNNTVWGIASQTANNYYSENMLINNFDNDWTANTVFFNPTQDGGTRATTGTTFDMTLTSTWDAGVLPSPLDTPSFLHAGTYTAPATSFLTWDGISVDATGVEINPSSGGNRYTINLGSGGITGTQGLSVMGQNITLNLGATDQTWTVPLNNFRPAIIGSGTITYTNPSRLLLRSNANFGFEGTWRADSGTIQPERQTDWSGSNGKVVGELLNNGGLRLSHNTSYNRIAVNLVGDGFLKATGASTDDGQASTLTTGSWASHGDIWGSGNLTVTSNSNYGKLVVDGDISHTGDTTVDNKSVGVTLELGSTSTYTFTPAANGTNNQINGLDATNSKLNANGTFIIDTASADITDGNAWTLVDVATLTETFSGTFAVQGYTEAANVWTLVDGNNTWTFTEATGVLGLAAAGGAPPPNTLFSTDFELDTIGAEPAGFAAVQDTGFAGNSLDVIAAESSFVDGPGSATTGGPGYQALQWLDTNSTDSNPDLLAIDLATGTTKDLVIRFDFLNVSGNNLRLQVLDDTDTCGIRLDLDNGGTIKNNGTGDTLEFTSNNKWHALEITTNLANDTYDLVIERDDRGSPDTFTDLPFNNAIANIATMEFVDFSGASNTAEYYIDNISIVEVAAASAYDSWASTMGLTVGVNDGTADNPDGDDLNNLAEFALDGDPLTATHIDKIAYQLATLGAEDAFTITTPVRNGVVFSGASEQVSADIDGVIYRVRGSADLASWALVVSEVTEGDATTIQSGLPTLSSGWSYRTFRLADDIDNLTKGFLRLRVEQP